MKYLNGHSKSTEVASAKWENVFYSLITYVVKTKDFYNNVGNV